MRLRTCPGAGCNRANECQRARDYRRDPLAEEFMTVPRVETTRTVYTDGRAAVISEHACDWFVQWRQQ